MNIPGAIMAQSKPISPAQHCKLHFYAESLIQQARGILKAIVGMQTWKVPGDDQLSHACTDELR